MAISTTLDSVALKCRASSDWLASLPPCLLASLQLWRRPLARLNRHPVRGIETWRVSSEKERLRSEKDLWRRQNEQRSHEDAPERQELARHNQA